MAPADSICIIMKPGNTSAMPASASVPRCETHQVSIRPVEACASITRMFGQASRSRVGRIAPCSSRRVRGLIASSVQAGAVPERSRSRRSTVRAAGCRRASRRRVASAAAGPAAHGEIGRRQRPAGGTVDQHRLGRLAGAAVDDPHALALGREMPVAPGQQGDQHRREIARRASVSTYSSRGGRSL